jgi:hypothetical protein
LRREDHETVRAKAGQLHSLYAKALGLGEFLKLVAAVSRG